MSFIYVHRCTCTHTRPNGIQSLPSWRRFQLKSTPRVASIPPALPSSSDQPATSLPLSRIPAQNQICPSPPPSAPFRSLFLSSTLCLSSRVFLFRCSPFRPTRSHEKFTISTKSSLCVKLMERVCCPRLSSSASAIF